MEIGNNKRKSIIYRIYKKCKIDPDTGCWIWQGGTSSKSDPTGGYGKISIHGVTSLVHRVVYITCYGYIPQKIKVDHICNNRLCCNPKHLQAVTHKKNCKLRESRKKKCQKNVK